MSGQLPPEYCDECEQQIVGVTPPGHAAWCSLSKRTFALVIAHYQEDLAWVREVSGWKIVIYEKGNGDIWSFSPVREFVFKKVDNIGREPTSFVQYILDHYDYLPDVMAFCQGRPFDHDGRFLERLKATIEMPVVPLFQHCTNELYASFDNGHPHHAGLPVGSTALRLGLEPVWPVTFAPGGQFIVTKEAVRSHPKEFYKLCLKLMMDSPTDVPWCFERLWQVIFLGK